MKAAFVLVAAIAAAVSGFAWRAVQRHTDTNAPQPELRWLQREFALNDAAMRRIGDLHRGYTAECEMMCAALQSSDDDVTRLLAAARRPTPELNAALNRSNQLTGDCQRRMVEHFYAVANEMPPEAARRYLELMTPVVAHPGHRWMKMAPP